MHVCLNLLPMTKMDETFVLLYTTTINLTSSNAFLLNDINSEIHTLKNLNVAVLFEDKYHQIFYSFTYFFCTFYNNL